MATDPPVTPPDWNAIAGYCEDVAEIVKEMSGRLDEEPELNRGGLNEISYLLWRLHEAASARAAQIRAEADAFRPTTDPPTGMSQEQG